MTDVTDGCHSLPRGWRPMLGMWGPARGQTGLCPSVHTRMPQAPVTRAWGPGSLPSQLAGLPQMATPSRQADSPEWARISQQMGCERWQCQAPHGGGAGSELGPSTTCPSASSQRAWTGRGWPGPPCPEPPCWHRLSWNMAHPGQPGTVWPAGPSGLSLVWQK